MEHIPVQSQFVCVCARRCVLLGWGKRKRASPYQRWLHQEDIARWLAYQSSFTGTESHWIEIPGCSLVRAALASHYNPSTNKLTLAHNMTTGLCRRIWHTLEIPPQRHERTNIHDNIYRYIRTISINTYIYLKATLSTCWLAREI